jgi:hypothetical protein
MLPNKFRELLLSLGVCHPLTFHILIFSSETPQSYELKLGRKHIFNVNDTPCTIYKGTIVATCELIKETDIQENKDVNMSNVIVQLLLV